MLWIKEDLQHDNNGGQKIQQLLATTTNGLKRIILQSQPEIQVIHCYVNLNSIEREPKCTVLGRRRWPLYRCWTRYF